MSTPKIKITNPAISAEIKRLHGITIMPGYVGQIRRGYLAAEEKRPLIEEAMASLAAKAKAERKFRHKRKAVAA